jgi:hypothetical protein
MELCLSSGEELVDVFMCMPNQQKAQVDLLEHIQADQETEEGKHEDILVLSSTIVSLQVEDRRASVGGSVSQKASSDVVKECGDDKVSIFWPKGLRV